MGAVPRGAWYAVFIAGSFGAFLGINYVAIGIRHLRRKRLKRLGQR